MRGATFFFMPICTSVPGARPAFVDLFLECDAIVDDMD